MCKQKYQNPLQNTHFYVNLFSHSLNIYGALPVSRRCGEAAWICSSPELFIRPLPSAWASFWPVRAHEPSLSLWTVRSPGALASLWGRWTEVGAEGGGTLPSGQGPVFMITVLSGPSISSFCPGGPAWMRVCRAPGQGHRPFCLGRTSWASV